ncbi:hypothetical protein PoB_005997600 [Plakobranchus ocellatus]|uniref:Uncharacterized protein n=1 Tax=Plakobranchus ocellatus TaxID=259542 RepID=A0AAV4CNL2_9GAST|nr:hypothetical protein PoB_005997600 [Plakobranchus ocellatus]
MRRGVYLLVPPSCRGAENEHVHVVVLLTPVLKLALIYSSTHTLLEVQALTSFLSTANFLFTGSEVRRTYFGPYSFAFYGDIRLFSSGADGQFDLKADDP